MALLSPRTKWRITRYGQSVEERLEKARNFFKSVMYKQKMCPACRALVERQQSECPFCGERLAGVPHGGAGRVLEAVLPQQGRFTAILLGANLFLFGLT